MPTPFAAKQLLIAVVILIVGLSLVAILIPHQSLGREGEIPETTNPTGLVKPGDGFQKPGDGFTKPPSTYLSSLYLWFLGFVGIAALLAFVIGGVMYMFAGANQSLVGEAKKWIWNAIWGIVLAAFSWLLLNTINPDLVGGFNIQTVIDSALRGR